MAGKKTSVYLTPEMQEALRVSGRSLPEVIRTGLGMSPMTGPSRQDLVDLMRGIVREQMGPAGDVTPAGEVPQEEVRETPAPVPPEPPVVLPALDKRILASTDALITEWSASWTGEYPPEEELTLAVRGEISTLLGKGVVPADISMGLAEWEARGNRDPSMIPATVEDVMNEEDH